MKFHRVQAMWVCAALTSLVTASSAWAQSSVSLSVEPADGGYVAQFPSTADLAQGGEVMVTATPAAGYEFVGWEGDYESSSSTITFILTDDTSLTAVFRLGDPGTDVYSLTAFVDPSGTGSIVRSPAQFEYADGSEVTLTAYADEGYVFAGWVGDVPDGVDASNPELVLVMDADKDVWANFSAGLTLDESDGGESPAVCGATGFASLGLLFSMMMMMKLGRSRS